MVADELALRKVAVAPEWQLSARAAVNDFGFGETLGQLNVFHGASVHKLVLKNDLYPRLQSPAEVDRLAQQLAAAIDRR